MKPPTGGPRIGPTTAGISTQLVAWIRSRFSTLRISTSRPTGIISAPPMPSKKRATTRKATLGALAQAMAPSRKIDDGAAEHGAGAEAVGDAPRHRNEDRQADQIGGQRDGQAGGGDAQFARHAGQGGGQHRAVQLLHEHGGADDQGDGAEMGSGSAGIGMTYPV